MKNHTKKIALTLVALALVATMTACANTYNDVPVASPSPSVSPTVINPISTPTALPGAVPTVSPTEPVAPTLSNQESAALANRCDERISKISEVEESVTVVLGDQSLSGVTFAHAYRGDLTDRIVSIVGDCVKEIAPYMQVSHVTNSPELYQRIAALRAKQEMGEGPGELKNEFDEIKGAIK